MSSDNYLTDYQRGDRSNFNGGWMGWARRFMDAKAVAAGQSDRHAFFMPRILQLLGTEVENPITVLEIGSGNGWALSYVHPLIRYIAVDRGSVFRESLEDRGIEFHLHNVSGNQLPLADATADVIILIHLIEHIPDSETFMNDLRRVLRPGGRIYIRTPNLARVKWVFWDDFTHVQPFTPNSLGHLMRSRGLKCRFMHASDHPRIMLDILTNGRMRNLIFSRFFGGKEIEAGYELEKDS
jgi:SAM-dependent methyltransferase